jgi:muramoyltetrapeptide carboxypeptidase
LGSGYLPKLKNKILLIEEISEPPYKIDRMLNQLRLNKVFKEIKGILIGNFLDCEEPDKTKCSLTIDEVWSDYFSSLKIPAIHSIPHGHSKNILTLPFGINVKLNIKKGRIEFLESSVM